MPNKTISMRIAPEKLNQIDKKSAEMKLSRTDFILKAADMLINSDSDFIKQYEIVVLKNKLKKLEE